MEDPADVHETAEVQDDIDARNYFVMSGFCFGEIAPVPVESVFRDKAGKEVVGSQGSASANNE